MENAEDAMADILERRASSGSAALVDMSMADVQPEVEQPEGDWTGVQHCAQWADLKAAENDDSFDDDEGDEDGDTEMGESFLNRGIGEDVAPEVTSEAQIEEPSVAGNEAALDVFVPPTAVEKAAAPDVFVPPTTAEVTKHVDAGGAHDATEGAAQKAEPPPPPAPQVAVTPKRQPGRVPRYLSATKASSARASDNAKKRACSSAQRPGSAKRFRNSPSLTKPHAFRLSASRMKRKPIETSDERAMRLAREAAAKQQALRAAERRAAERAQHGAAPAATASLTVAQSPMLKTTARTKARKHGSSKEESLNRMLGNIGHRKPHHMTLRSGKKARARLTTKGPVRPTHAEPFSLATDRRGAQKKLERDAQREMAGVTSEGDTQGAQAVPLAEAVRTFQSKTPRRFHTKSSTSAPSPLVSASLQSLTEPTEPSLRVSSRARPKAIPTAAEREVKEMEGIEPFKARPVPQNVLQSAGDLGVPRIKKRPNTETHAFKFRTDSRARSTAATGDDDARQPPIMPHEQRALEADRLATYKPTNTVPKAPHFATEDRAARRPERRSPMVSEPASRPEERKPFQPAPRSEPLELTQTEPFNLSGVRLHEESKEAFDAMVNNERKVEESRRKFKANDMPNYPAPMEVAPSDKLLTVASSPECNTRHKQAIERKERMVIQEHQKEERARVFRAQPVPQSLAKQHEPPKVPGRLLEIPVNVAAKSTKERAAKRKAFDEKTKERLEHEAAVRAEEERCRAAQQARELKEYRKTLIHKATAVPDSSRA